MIQDKTLTINYRICQKEDLNEADLNLVEKACQATYTCYAPYSNFHVGAAVLLDNGCIITGSNQENAAFGAGTCAERSALFFAHSQYPEANVCAIAVAARGTDEAFTTGAISPCGLCRQALIEAQTRAQKPLRVIMYGTKGILLANSISDLLPFQFDAIV